MKRASRAAALVALALCAAGAARAAPPNGFDARVKKIMHAIGVPGMAVTIVEDGHVTLAHGYGLRRLGSNDAVDADTVFQLGSISKAFTTTALAILVDRGKIGWGDRVIEDLPWFQMYDPWVTREMTVRDLLTHRSGLGLGEGDLLYVPRSSLSRAETVRRLRYLKPATSFRSGYAYDNILYIAAGQLIDQISGQRWEDFVRDQVLRAAGMGSATTSDVERRANPNRAWPHMRRNGPIHGMGDQTVLDDSGHAEFGPELGENAAPAGGIAASANDMGRWIQIQLAHGELPDGSGRLFSADAAREMWTPRVPVPIHPLPDPVGDATPQFDEYALGWTIRDYHGHKLIMHSGAVFGAQAVLMLLPDQNVGFAVMINCEDGEAVLGVAFELLDHYLGLPYRDWTAAWSAMVKQRDQHAIEALKKQTSHPAQVGPSLPLASYAGKYADAWYGPISIELQHGRLVVDFEQTPGMVGELTHWQYDTFRVDWRDPMIEPAYLTFALTADGGIDRISMQPVSPLADFSFDYKDLDLRPVTKN